MSYVNSLKKEKSMKKKILIIIMASASVSLFAMDVPDQQKNYLNIKLVDAVGAGDLNKIQKFISAGASLNPSKSSSNPLCAAISSFRLQPQRRLEVVQLLLDKGARPDVLYSRYNATPVMFAAEYGTLQDVLLLLTAIPLEERQYIKNTFPFFSKKMRSTNLISKDTHGLIQKQVIEQLVERQMQRIALLLAMRQTDGKTAKDLGIRNIYHHRKEMSELLDLNNAETYAQIRTAVEQNVRRLLFAPQNQ
jgi:ankyrin repeat protein